MARIIGVAGIRLVADQRGLAANMRVILREALTDATRGIGPGSTQGIEDDSNRTATRIKKLFAETFSSIRGLAGRVNNAVAAGTRLTLIGAAAGTALAGVTSLTTGLIGLVAAAGQAAGVIGLLPAVLLAVKAGTATVQLGMVGMGEAFKAVGSGDAAALNEALKKLSPSAAAFVREVNKVKPAFDAMRLNIQEALFKGLSGSIAQLATQYLPIANRLFAGLGTEMNKAAKEAISFATSARAVGQTNVLVDNIKASFAGLVPAIRPALSAFLDISQVGSNFLPRLSQSIAGAAASFGEFIRGAAASGQLQQFFENAIATVQQLGAILVQFGAGLGAVFSAAQASGAGILDTLLQVGTAFNRFASSAAGQSALTEFFASMRSIIAAVIPVVLTIAQVVGTTLAPILADIARTILPVLNVVIQQFGAALQAARPGIQALVQGLATLLEVFGPTITFAVQLAGILGGVLGRVLQTLAPVLARVAEALLSGLIAIMPKLEPLIIQVADALVQVIDAALPLIPVFLQLVAAVLPPLVGLIEALAPIVVELARVLAALLPPITAVVVTILNILIPPIQFLAAVVAQTAGAVADVFQALSGTVTAILTALGAVISGIWGTIVNIFTGAVNIIGGIVRGAFEGIRSFIAGALSGIGNAVRSGLDAVVGFFSRLPGQVLGFLGNLASDAFNAGVNIIKGIVNGLGSIAGSIVNKLKQIVSQAWDAVLSFFGISSPSKLAERTFRFVGEGAIVGLEKITPDVVAAAADLAASAMDAMGSGLAGGLTLSGSGGLGGGGTAGGGGVVLNQVNVMREGADVTQFASEVARLGAQRLAVGASSLPVSVGSVQSGIAGPGTVFGVGGI